MTRFIDLNADAGESFGRWKLGHDEELLPLVTSVNVACGWHAGDPETMRRSVDLARTNGVCLGAHPGFPDLTGFGRRSMALKPREAASACLYQYGALKAFAEHAGTPVWHMKPHGALYGLTMKDDAAADAIAEAMAGIDPSLIVVLLAGRTADRVAEQGYKVAREAFADLDYDDDGYIIIDPHSRARDPELCAEQAVNIVRGRLTSINGTTFPVEADTVCLHGDRPNAVDIAHAIRARLEAEGVTLTSMPRLLAAGV